mmetsp:Transcript_43016/g.103720  ORF Transcript_43016/g.103720 Transcript_43016/m.103720 type:complete len:191 (+) Transcript_43016:768-1340(+)
MLGSARLLDVLVAAVQQPPARHRADRSLEASVRDTMLKVSTGSIGGELSQVSKQSQLVLVTFGSAHAYSSTSFTCSCSVPAVLPHSFVNVVVLRSFVSAGVVQGAPDHGWMRSPNVAATWTSGTRRRRVSGEVPSCGSSARAVGAIGPRSDAMIAVTKRLVTLGRMACVPGSKSVCQGCRSAVLARVLAR